MSHITTTYSPNTSESDLNDLSFSFFDDDEEEAEGGGGEENSSNEEMGMSREKQSTSGVNKQPTNNNLSPSGSLCTSSVSLLSSASNPPGQCLGEQKSWSISSQMNEQCDKHKKCVNSVKKIDRRMAKQMTERKRRDRINALLNNLRTLILKLLHKNPRHHRKLEKADILELVVSFLKKELNQTRGKMSSVNPPTTSISQQTNTPPAILLKQTKYPAKIESCTPLIYPQSSSLNHSELFPLLNQPNNYHFVKNNNNTNNHNHNVASKISYPFNDSSIQQYPHLYTSMYPYPYNLPCCRGEPCQSLAVSHYSTPLTYQPIVLISPTEDFDDINKENRVSMNKNHNYFKNTNYTPSCYSSNDTLDRCSIIRQPMNTLNNNNNNNNNDYYYQANNQAYSSQVQLKQQSPESMMAMTKLYPDILNNHLPEEPIAIQGENCYKCCYLSSTLNDDGQSSQNFIRNAENHNCNCSNPAVTLNHRRMHSSASTSSTSSSGESTNHLTTLWRPYV